MTGAAALVALACYAPPPAPIGPPVPDAVHRAPLGEAVGPAPGRADVAAAIEAVAPIRRRHR
ncbi:hypothetical protein GOFOIKOB_4514 [Methylobacterium tardum]|uniref:Uncharacterized protein n=1 Tax=Methylobacterium tardum TaxID=374432 RepID=A0AA37WWU6_9HYPH|nr:hypothetical protein [Methylobacterium tardum]URD39459.1 hypothetical protein M6G65_14240 [Methylobacterium tardum]GJE51455.1 hypothetical protein GOFOIKOB_4514 [Methylobacterium tardum]GLS73648.1 hypothetical protein GCM10007890_56630 [Methylobacterium tardum]